MRSESYMKSGYKLLWSDRALNDLKHIIEYLTENWSQKEIRNFSRRLDRRLDLIVVYPRLFPKTNKKKNLRKSVLTKHTTIYYGISRSVITIITLFDPRMDPKNLKI